MNKYIAILFLVTSILVSCDNQEASLQSIKDIESQLFNSNNKVSLDKDLAEKAIAAYTSYASKYKDDPETPGYLFKAADVHRGLRQNDKAIEVWENIYNTYPDFEKAPHCLFLMGFSYENDLKNLDKAKGLYEQFLSKYPNHDLADDVQFSIKNLGKSPEEIIKSFEAANN